MISLSPLPWSLPACHWHWHWPTSLCIRGPGFWPVEVRRSTVSASGRVSLYLTRWPTELYRPPGSLYVHHAYYGIPCPSKAARRSRSLSLTNSNFELVKSTCTSAQCSPDSSRQINIRVRARGRRQTSDPVYSYSLGCTPVRVVAGRASGGALGRERLMGTY
ncbi:hypothetical protein L226DRAFT_265059 [Lentinus tigrinus ALCF2SS1-7]|uniref:uncharacterized protein n=1 Tax=Lentinus tigrinus ALCF2SS1-7 TaxID=1328758 RepID=UPI00116614C1|nr:hypothetical protein L226DRAFT_265059 [Lentinus tigrinus ALCF2SS1-7]